MNETNNHISDKENLKRNSNINEHIDISDLRNHFDDYSEVFQSVKNQEYGLEQLFIAILDSKFGIFEPIDGYEDILDIPINQHSVQFQKRRNAVIKEILSQIHNKKDTIETVEIDRGVLHITYNNGESPYQIDIVEEWNNALKTPEEKVIIQQTQKKQEQLYESIAHDAFFEGNVLIDYSKDAAIAVAAGYTVYKGMKFLPEGVYITKQIRVNSPNGIKIVELPKAFVGTRKELANAAANILDTTGLKYDTKTKKIINPALQLLP